MGLVDYSDSGQSSSDEQSPHNPPSKKRKISTDEAADEALPPLPASFLDQYSSAVRTSTRDDPALHGGRKRVIPHVTGNWPAHVYLEWHPATSEFEILSQLVSDVANSGTSEDVPGKGVHSLLQNDLGVSLPLHISLSRPLALKTDQKETFLDRLKFAIDSSAVNVLQVRAADLIWHSNENATRWFLVFRLHKPSQNKLTPLLTSCNDVARAFEQPLLYAESKNKGKTIRDAFHISIAWSLQNPNSRERKSTTEESRREEVTVSSEMLRKLSDIKIDFAELKVRIGQAVHTLPLGRRKRSQQTATS